VCTIAPLKSEATRMIRPLLAAALTLVLTYANAAPTGALHCAKLLDVRTGQTLTNQTISFTNGIITAITPTTPPPPPPPPPPKTNQQRPNFLLLFFFLINTAHVN